MNVTEQLPFVADSWHRSVPSDVSSHSYGFGECETAGFEALGARTDRDQIGAIRAYALNVPANVIVHLHGVVALHIIHRVIGQRKRPLSLRKVNLASQKGRTAWQVINDVCSSRVVAVSVIRDRARTAAGE